MATLKGYDVAENERVSQDEHLWMKELGLLGLKWSLDVLHSSVGHCWQLNSVSPSHQVNSTVNAHTHGTALSGER